MRRTDREVTDAAEVRAILCRAKVLHMGMVDGGRPYVVPLHYGFEWGEDGVTLWCHGAREGRKIDTLRANPNVFIEADCDVEAVPGGDVACRWGSYYASVMGDGVATIVEDPDEKAHGLICLMRTQTGHDFEVTPRMAEAVCVLRIDVPHVTAKARVKPADEHATPRGSCAGQGTRATCPTSPSPRTTMSMHGGSGERHGS